MAFRGAFGMGTGLPQRVSSGSGLPPSAPPLPSPSAYPRTGSSFPFGPAGLISPTPAPANGPATTGEPSANLDEFPALGGALPSVSQTSSLLSYASQAGTGLLPSALNGTLPPLQGALPPGSLLPNALLGLQAREFSQDDFPALGGFGGQHELGMGLPSALPGSNGVPSRSASSSEQASAAAALQHQQAQIQHRANLLGSMNGNPNQGFPLKQQLPPGNTQWSPSPASSNPVLAAQLEALHLSNGNVSANSMTDQLLSISPSLLPPSGPPGVPRAVGLASILPPTSPLPPSSSLAAPGSTTTNPVSIPQTPAQQVLFSPADRYGLLGLLHIIKSSDSDTSMLALGSDLTSLGLDLGATENLYSTFITPWSDSKAFAQLNIEPEFVLPSCYNVGPPPAQTKIGNFSDETLFFIFYSQPRDSMQEMAAHELYKHNWRYHKELRLWLTKEAGTEPTQKTQSYERGSYIFFDPTLWERVRKDFVLVFESLERKQ